MLTIRDADGNDLVQAAPEDRRESVVGQALAPVVIQASIVEDNSDLPSAWVNGTLDWNDGSIPTVFAKQTGTLTVSQTKALGVGEHIVRLQGRNFISPVHDTVSVNFQIEVVKIDEPAPPPELIFGPILPRDTGDPNASNWEFNTASDLLILESSVKMLLITQKGERLMEPDYGTNLRRILFENNSAAIESLVEQEIVEALNRFEPRLKIQTISIQRNTDRSVTVSATFLSRLTSRSFETNLEFVR